MNFLPLREAIVEVANRLFSSGVMSHSGHGNLSARLDDRRMLITTVGIVRGLTPERFAVVDVDGSVEEGHLNSENREIIAMHSEVYRALPRVGGIVHAHAPALTAFALANKPLPVRHETLLRFGQVDAVPIVAWAPRGSNGSVRGIIDALSRTPRTNGVLLANHGPLAFGEDIAEAASVLVAMEECAELEIASQSLGGGRDFPPGALDAVRTSMAAAS